MGPQVFHGAVERIKSYVAIARREGATVFTGGGNQNSRAHFRTALLSANNFQRRGQFDAGGPGRNFWTRDMRDHFQRRRRPAASANDTMYGLSAASGHATYAGPSLRARRQSRHCLDQYLQHDECASRLVLQAVGLWTKRWASTRWTFTHRSKSVWIVLSGKPIGWLGSDRIARVRCSVVYLCSCNRCGIRARSALLTDRESGKCFLNIRLQHDRTVCERKILNAHAPLAFMKSH